MIFSKTLKQNLITRFILVSTLPVIIIGIITSYYLSKKTNESIETENRLLAKSAAKEISAELKETRTILEQLSIYLINEETICECGLNKPEVLNRILDTAIQTSSYFESVSILDKNGKITNVGLSKALVPRKADYVGLDMSRFPLFIKVMKEKRGVWSDAFLSIVTGELSLSLAIPHRDGALVVNFSIQRFNDMLQSVKNTEKKIDAIILDKEGVLIFSPDVNLSKQKKNYRNIEPVSKGLSGQEGTYKYLFDNVYSFGTVTKIPETQWLVLISQDYETAYQPVEQMLGLFIIGLIAAICIAILFAIIISSRLTEPLLQVVESAQKISSGDYNLKITHHNYLEITNLTTSINDMTQAIKTRESTLNSLAATIMGYSGQECFDKIAAELCNSLGAEISIVGILIEQYKIQALSMMVDGELSKGFIYNLKDTPCEQVYTNGLCLYPKDVQSLFPNDEYLVKFGIKGYIGVPIIGKDNRVLGLINANSRNEILLSPLKEQMLKMIAARAASEIERIESEREIIEREERFRATFENAPVGIAHVSLADGSLIRFNSMFCRIFDCDENEIRNLQIDRYFVDEDHPRIEASMKKVLSGIMSSFSCEIKYVRKDKKIKWGNLTVSLLKSTDGVPLNYIYILEDVTEKNIRVLDLARLATVVEQTSESIVITDANGIIEYVNPAYEKVTGYSRTEIIGHKPSILKSGKHDAQFYSALWDTIKSGKVWYGHFTNRKKSGELFEEEVTISPIRNERSEIVNYVAIKTDVTHERELETQLRQAQKMEAIGTLAGGIAHDFNNILNAIMGYTDLTLLQINKNSDNYNNLMEVMKASKRAADLIQQMLIFSRSKEREKKPLRLSAIVKEAIKLVRGLIPKSIEIKQSIDEMCPVVMADPTQVHQIIVNLCTNAYHAMIEKGGCLTISVSQKQISEIEAKDTLDLKTGEYVLLSVKDTGHGMDEDTISRIFEPYYTTKKVGEGTGLGLATVHGIVKSYDGAIKVYSTPGVGTEFVIYIPAIHAAPEDVETVSAEKDSIFGNETILFLDDEIPLTNLIKLALEKYGYKVRAFSKPSQALLEFSAAPDNYDVVVTDLTMPGISGTDIAKEVHQRRPEIPIILCTGFAKRIESVNLEELGVRKIVYKPYVAVDLARAIRSVFTE